MIFSINRNSRNSSDVIEVNRYNYDRHCNRYVSVYSGIFYTILILIIIL
jgi:hypothetical protein